MTDLPLVVDSGEKVGRMELGWRSWEVCGTLAPFETPRLYSVSHSVFSWPPREAAVATCDKGHKPEQIPVNSCMCGLYSAKTLRHLMTMPYHTYDGEQDGMYCVIGQVKVWGDKVIEGTQGWRAQKGYPYKLYLPYEIQHLYRPLKEAYGCEVALLNFLKKGRRVA